MTKEEALKLKTFNNLCTCGGYAYNLNGRSEKQPHMPWYPQYKEYSEWYEALHSDKSHT